MKCNYDKDFLMGIYTDLLKTRMMEQKLVDIYAEGIVPGHIHSGMGQEGTYVGVTSTRKPGDYFKFGHRPLSINYIVGEPMDEFFGELLGKLSGNALGHGGTNHLGRLEDGVVGFSGTLGADAGVSVGAALTIDMEGRDNVSYFFYGDGTSNRGPIHEAMSLASVWKLPGVVCLRKQPVCHFDVQLFQQRREESRRGPGCRLRHAFRGCGRHRCAGRL